MTMNHLLELEALVDQYGLSQVCTELAGICHVKAEHLRVNWQDHAGGGCWDRKGNVIEGIIRKLCCLS